MDVNAKCMTMESIIDEMPGGVAVVEYGFKSVFKYYNEELMKMIGYTKEEFEKTFRKNSILLVLPDDRSDLEGAFRAAKGLKEVKTTQFRILKKDGNIGWCRAQIRFKSAHLGKIVFYCIFTDITKEKKLELQLKKQQDYMKRQYIFLDSLYQNVPCGIVQCTCEAKPYYLNINQAGCQILGYTSKENLMDKRRKNLMETVWEEDHLIVQNEIIHLLQCKRPVNFECRLKQSNGSYVWVSATMNILIRPEKATVIQFVFIDATVVKEQEAEINAKQMELESAYVKLQIAFEQSAMKMWEYDIQNKEIRFIKDDVGVMLQETETQERIFNIHDVDTIHNNFFKMQAEMVERLERGESPVEGTLHVEGPNGLCRWQKIKYKTLYNEDGTPRTAIGVARDVSDEVEALEKYHIEKEAAMDLKEKSQRDCLTGLLNRGAFEDYVTEKLKELPKDGKRSAFFLLDIDDFKDINDTLGHGVGDEALIFVAKKLTGLFRHTDYVARLGGDEFVAYMEDISSEYLALDKGERVCQEMEKWPYATDSLQLSVSIGLSIVPQHGTNFQDLYHKADLALYDAKQQGKNMCQIYNPEILG